MGRQSPGWQPGTLARTCGVDRPAPLSHPRQHSTRTPCLGQFLPEAGCRHCNLSWCGLSLPPGGHRVYCRHLHFQPEQRMCGERWNPSPLLLCPPFLLKARDQGKRRACGLWGWSLTGARKRSGTESQHPHLTTNGTF